MKSWTDFLAREKDLPYMRELLAFVEGERALGKEIYPPTDEMFRAFELTPFDSVKVVILGQDPYHGSGQAHGLAFSVRKDIPIPPSLRNIFKELQSDLGIEAPPHGCLENWARQGVLLLNTVLTVEKGEAGSHQGKGWEKLTDKVVETLANEKKGLVFVLWGAPSQKKCRMVDPKNHLVLMSAHPSPLSAYRDFFGSKPFSKANTYLQAQGVSPIDWHP